MFLIQLKYGVGSNPTSLTWMISGAEQWNIPFDANTWFNFAYDIDVSKYSRSGISVVNDRPIVKFSAGTVGLWASTGSDPLKKVVQNRSAPTSTNSADWHLGVLRIVTNQTPEDWYFSGVYVENGPITTAIGSGGSPPSSSPPASTSPSTTQPTTTQAPTTTTAGPTQTQWGQCGGMYIDQKFTAKRLTFIAGVGWTGPTVCASPFTCTPVSPPYYSQACISLSCVSTETDNRLHSVSKRFLYKKFQPYFIVQPIQNRSLPLFSLGETY